MGRQTRNMLELNTSEPINETYQRDGCFDEKDIFLIYENEDLKKLIDNFQKALNLIESSLGAKLCQEVQL